MQRKNKEIKQIFFDLDGTLLDTAPQFYLALSNVIERNQQEQVSFDEVRNLVSDGVGALIDLAFKISESHENFESLRTELLKEYSKEIEDLEVKAIAIGGESFGPEQIDRVAKLPTLDEARSMLMSLLLAPITKLTRTLNEVPSEVVRVLAAVRDEKQNSS